LAVEIYREYCFGHVQSVLDLLDLATAISLAPLLVLFVLRHLLPVMLIYASVLFLILILIWQVDYPAQCSFGAAPFRKFDEPGLLLFFLGMLSTAVVLVWVTIRSVVFLRRVLKLNGAER
jgi:hypothetical protein